MPNAAAAAPKRKPDEAVEMKSGPAEVDRKMAEAEVTEPQLQKSNESKFQAAVEAKKDAKADAAAGPTKYRQVEQPALAGAQAGAETLVQQQLQAMGGGREAALQGVLGKQQAAKGQDEQARAQVAQKIQQIFGVCQQKVEARLQRLDGEVNAAFDAGAAQARKQFEEYVGRRMDAYKEERYGGIVGAGRWVKDQFLGMPDEVNAFYTEGKQRYLATMEATIDRVATMVETGLREATAEVARGKKEVDDYVKSLPASLRQVGQQAQAQIQAQFDGLGQSIKDKQGELVDTLAQKYNDETQKLDQRIGELKAQNRGLVDKALDLVGDVIQTIKKLGEMLRNVLARAAGIVGRILADPIGFIGNLVRGAKEGFSRFAANIDQHLQQGLIGWLTGALAGAGLQMPASFDLKGIFSLVSQVLNMTWQAIRSRAVRILGERAVRALEQGSDIVKLLVTGGPVAIWEHLKNFVGDLKSVVVDQIKSFVIGKVISAGITWILSLLNPASAFVKACKAIYDIVMFFVERAAQIADLVSAVLDSIEAVAGGAVGAMVAKIEGALVKALPVVIGFLASLLGIGGISEKVKAIIQKVRVPIEKAIDWVLTKAWDLLKKTGGWVKRKTGSAENATEHRTPHEMRADLDRALVRAEDLLRAPGATPETVRSQLPTIQAKYGLVSLVLKQGAQGTYHVVGKVNPDGRTKDILLSQADREWEQAWRAKQAEVESAMQQFVPRFQALDPSAQVHIRGGLASGVKTNPRKRSPQGQCYVFNPSDFDIDAYVISNKMFQQSIEKTGDTEAAVRGQILGSKSGIPAVNGIIKEMRSTLAKISGNRDVGENAFRFNVIIRSAQNAAATNRRDQKQMVTLGLEPSRGDPLTVKSPGDREDRS